MADVIWADMQRLLGEIHEHINGFHRAEIIRDGYDIVIAGSPNAGKSSLLNALAQRDAAIVSDEPGTTRDLVELSLDLDGIKVRLTDTAGIRDGAGKVETIGIERARQRAEAADLVLLLVDASAESAELPAHWQSQCHPDRDQGGPRDGRPCRRRRLADGLVPYRPRYSRTSRS